MKSTKFITSLLFILLLGFTSCQKDDGNSVGQQQEIIPDAFSEYFGNEISRDFLGNVIDTNKNPIEGVTITIGNETALTDSNGVFIIRDANVKERFGYIKAKKSGYIHGSRSVVPSEGTNKVTIMLLEANIVSTINSGSSETVTLSNGSSVSFDGNFIKEDGSEYTGSVDVIMHHLDPADDDMAMQMPGMLYAENTDGAERMLQTLGMLAVELRSNSGEELNLAEGSTSEIKMPVDASLMGIAPATIPLWYFDEVNGYWKEEGQATLQGNMYVGNVSHFSFWNCDIQVEAIMICVTITDEGGNELSNLDVEITSTTSGTTNGYTNENGEVCGLVPLNESLELIIFNYDLCGNASIANQTIGPFSMDSSVSIIVPNNINIITETINGTFNNCNGNNVTNGYVIFEYLQNRSIKYIKNGNFEMNIIRCNTENSFVIEGIDIEESKTTGRKNFSFDTPSTDLPILNTCNNAVEFVTYQVFNHPIINYFENISYILSNGNPRIKVYSTVSDAYFIIHLHNFNGIGEYLAESPGSNPQYIIFRDQNQDGTNPYYFVGTIDVTLFEGVGGYINLNFNGELINESDTTAISNSFSGTIRALID